MVVEAGGSESIRFELRRRDLSIWDVSRQAWKIERGIYMFYVGPSNRDFGF